MNLNEDRSIQLSEDDNLKQPESLGELNPKDSGRFRLPFGRWGWFLAFTLSGPMFVTGILTLFSPMPLIYLYLYSGFKPFLLALVMNGVWVGLIAGWSGVPFYFALVAPIAVLTPWLIFQRNQSLEKVVLASLGICTGLGLFFAGIWQVIGDVGAVQLLRETISQLVEQLQQMGRVPQNVPLEEIKTNLLLEFPAAYFIFVLVMTWVNIVFFLKSLPQTVLSNLKTNLDALLSWKAPDWMIWPTILAGATVLFDLGVFNAIGLNFFRFFMVVYGLQGLSVLSFIFRAMGLQPLMRAGIYVVVIVFMMPLLFAAGFFDLWFDFREKVVQRIQPGRRSG
jgi:hypothetical protein